MGTKNDENYKQKMTPASDIMEAGVFHKAQRVEI